jgi:hypothetical protein
MWFFLCAKIHNNFGIAKKKANYIWWMCVKTIGEGRSSEKYFCKFLANILAESRFLAIFAE